MTYTNLSIKNWALEDRPREKLIRKGIHSLSDAELIAILIGSGTKNRSALELSKSLLHAAKNNLFELGKFSLADLQKTKGIGPARAVIILAAMELGRRRKSMEPVKRQKISSSKDACLIFQPLLCDLPHEQFWVILLNRANHVLDTLMISSGGIAGTVIDTRMVLKPAIEQLCSGIILCHNHPSGNRMPSDADIRITRKIKEASALLDISLLDHLIIAGQEYYSFADEGLI
jgi:DNA repair protein RadC